MSSPRFPSLTNAKSRDVPEANTLFHRIVVAEDIGLEDIVSDDPVTVPDTVGAGTNGTDLEANLTLDIHPPQPSYDPQNYSETSRAHGGTHDQGMEVHGCPTATNVIPEQHIGVHSGGINTQQEIDIAVV